MDRQGGVVLAGVQCTSPWSQEGKARRMDGGESEREGHESVDCASARKPPASITSGAGAGVCVRMSLGSVAYASAPQSMPCLFVLLPVLVLVLCLRCPRSLSLEHAEPTVVTFGFCSRGSVVVGGLWRRGEGPPVLGSLLGFLRTYRVLTGMAFENSQFLSASLLLQSEA